MAKNETAIVEIILKGQQANASLKDIEKSARALRAQLGKLPTDSAEFAEKTKQFQEINKRLKSIKDDVNGVGGVFQSIGKEIKGFGLLAAGYLGFDWLTGSIKGIIKSNAELSDSLADIRKTTGMTETEARKLNTALGQINTRTAAKELRNIAIVGGQLGIAKNDIFGFTVAVDKMNVALGDEFTGGAEEVTKAMGGLRNIFTDIKTDKVDQDLLHIGNAINELASSGAATGPVVSDFANRIGGVGITLGLTSGQVLGLSATLQELNVSTERGGTAVTKILQKMTTNTAEFAKVAGLPLQEFTDLVNKDLYGAFVKVVEGSQKGNVSATEFGKTLDSLGVDGAGASEVFAKLGTNTKMLSDKVNLANTSLKGTNSIMAEFNTKNQTLGAEMERLSKGFSKVFTNSAFSEGIKSIVSSMADLFDSTKKVSQVMEEERKQLMMTETEIFSYNVGNENRTKLIKQLQEQYPDYLGNIDAETVSNEKLRFALDKVNASLINKIILQKKDEEITELADEAGEKGLAAAEARLKLTEALTEAYNDNARAKRLQQQFEGLPLEFAAEQFLIPENFQSAGLSAYSDKIKNINDALANWKKAQVEANAASMPLNDALNEKTELMKSLGIETENTAAKTVATAKEQSKAVISIDEETKKKLEEEAKKLKEALEQIEQEQMLRKLSTEERILQEIKLKYDKLREMAHGNAQMLARIKRDEEEDIMKAIMDSFQKQSEVETKEYYDKLKRYDKLIKDKEALEKNEASHKSLSIKEQNALELQAKSEQWDAIIVKANEHNKSLLVGEEAYYIDLMALYMAKQTSIEDLKAVHEQKLTQIQLEENKKRVSAFEDVYSSFMGVTNTYNQARSNSENTELAEERARFESSKQSYKSMLDRKVINQNEYDSKLQELEKQQTKREREIRAKQAEREKKAAIFNALINAAVAASKANTATPYPPVNAALMVLAAAQGMAQVALIESTPIAYAAGGYNQTSNDPQGYTSGPTLFKNSASGRDFIAGEAGQEWISPHWMLNDPWSANIIGMLENYRVRGFAAGGSTSTQVSSSTQNFSTSTSGQSFDFNSLAQSMNRLSQALETGIEAKLYYDSFTKDLNSIENARRSAQS
jgi:TP901 family phage tail tape measure protein